MARTDARGSKSRASDRALAQGERVAAIRQPHNRARRIVGADWPRSRCRCGSRRAASEVPGSPEARSGAGWRLGPVCHIAVRAVRHRACGLLALLTVRNAESTEMVSRAREYLVSAQELRWQLAGDDAAAERRELRTADLDNGLGAAGAARATVTRHGPRALVWRLQRTRVEKHALRHEPVDGPRRFS